MGGEEAREGKIIMRGEEYPGTTDTAVVNL